eukprot:m.284026 g.284026  ORF g.284026 m.284026 type:complete len:438 (-) comp16339_c3_seq10:94-1407(-)
MRLLSFFVVYVLCCASFVTGKTLLVTSFGAKGDNATDNTAAIMATYKACAASGPGTTVVFPGSEGQIYRSFPFEIRCNDSVTLIENGATIKGIEDEDRWPFGPDCPEPAQGKTPKQMAPLLYMNYANNVSVMGGGTVDGIGSMFWSEACGNWWCPKGYTIKSPKAFRPFLFRIDHSNTITITNITMKNPGFWNLVPVHSKNIVVTDCLVNASWDDARGHRTPNTDGFEPMWSSDVTMSRCRIYNGDDCVTIKSGSSNVLVEDLYCEKGDGLTIGSVWYDNVTNVTYRRVIMNQTHNGPMIKGRSQGNATVADITFEDVQLIDVRLALTIDCVYETQGTVVPNIGVLAENVMFKNISGTVSAGSSHLLNGDPSFLVDAAGTFICLSKRPCSFSLENINVRHADASNKTEPVWLCNNTNILEDMSVSPPLSHFQTCQKN